MSLLPWTANYGPAAHIRLARRGLEDDIGNATTGALVTAGLIGRKDVEQVIDAYFADPTAGKYVLGGGYGIDVAEALASRPSALKVLGNSKSGVSARRAAVRTALMFARPVKLSSTSGRRPGAPLDPGPKV